MFSTYKIITTVWWLAGDFKPRYGNSHHRELTQQDLLEWWQSSFHQRLSVSQYKTRHFWIHHAKSWTNQGHLPGQQKNLHSSCKQRRDLVMLTKQILIEVLGSRKNAQTLMRISNRCILRSIRPGTPLESHRLPCINGNTLSDRIQAIDITCHVSGLDIDNRVGVWWDTHGISITLVDSPNDDVGEHVMSIGTAHQSQETESLKKGGEKHF